MMEDGIVGWHHRLDGHEFEQALEFGDGQEALHAAVHGVAKNHTVLSDWKMILEYIATVCSIVTLICKPKIF